MAALKLISLRNCIKEYWRGMASLCSFQVALLVKNDLAHDFDLLLQVLNFGLLVVNGSQHGKFASSPALPPIHVVL
eukprot:8680406-Karenia_brevis.AAC.1